MIVEAGAPINDSCRRRKFPEDSAPVTPGWPDWPQLEEREDPWREAWSLPWVALRLHLEHGQGGKSWGGVGGRRVGSIALGSGIAGIGTEVQSTKAFVE